MSRFAQVKELVMGLEGDFEKFYEKNNQAAGTRVRKGMQELKELAQEIRIEVQNMKNEEEAKKEKTA
jgi:2'-5' RNA ligase